ncbi:hypothetical protein L1049_016961 [Liquidambar formosana]|uniref:Uncharacterized protein n=1 Tax=Liquidambar formosana TaxID=63359 RepID=A0AAP0X3T6_LIQFO
MCVCVYVMNSLYITPSSSHSPFLHFNTHQWRHRNPAHSQSAPISCSMRRRNARSRNNNSNTHIKSKPKSATDHNLEMVIDIDHIKTQASSSLKTLFNSTQFKLRRFFSSGKDAYSDLQTLITIDDNRRVIILCRRSSLMFMGNLVLWSCVVVLVFRVLADLGLGLGFWGRFGVGYGAVVRRDRSLAGREVVVGKKRKNFRVLGNPVSPARGTLARGLEAGSKNWVRTEEKLPKWWPVLLPPQTSMMNMEEYQKKANRLIRAIMDNRMSGKDILEDDIIQLRRICRTSGARVSIDTANARDSLYRASVDFVLNMCNSASSTSTTFHIDGEDARQFIAGLSDNIGLENIRAARIISAAVAARTRSRFLQAWALEMQGKHLEALVELSSICLIHRIFPPEESSPEMEMVAQGLEKHLKVEQREFLMNMLRGVCDEESCRSMAEALGLEETHKNSGGLTQQGLSPIGMSFWLDVHFALIFLFLFFFLASKISCVNFHILSIYSHSCKLSTNLLFSLNFIPNDLE